VQTSQWTCPWCLPSFREEGGRESKIASIVLKTFLPGLRLAGACGPVPRTRYFGVKRGWLAVHDLTCYPKVVARGPGGVFLTGAGSGWRILCGTAVGGWWAPVASVVTAGPAGPPAAGSESVEYCPARGRYLWVKDLCEAARDGSDSEIGHSVPARPRPLLGVVPRVKRPRLRATRI
jgi:hypothetical protein